MAVINDWDLASVNLSRAAQHDYRVAVLPMGATEAHNRHLPEGMDSQHTTYVARHCCELAWGQCQSVICLPAIPYGVDCNLLSFPLTIHVCQEVLDAMIREIIRSLRIHEIRKVVIINGHGGNEFSPLIRQMQCDTDVHVFLCDWWKVGHDKYDEIFEKADDHAGEFETSVALALDPELVELGQAGDGSAKDFRFEALRRGWVRTSRDFAQLNDHCGVGKPDAASAAKGRQYLELVCKRISSFLIELARAEIDAYFPYCQ